MHGHGEPYHNLMLDQAGAYFSDTYGGKMIHLRGLEPTPQQLAKLKIPAPAVLNLSELEKTEIGEIDEHAGFEETSRLMFLRPDLVSSFVKQLPPLTTNNPEEFFGLPRKTGNWRGYLSSPRLASAQAGALLQTYRSDRDNALALAILDGIIEERQIPRYGKRMIDNKQLISALAEAQQNEHDRERKQREWIKKNNIE